MVRQKPGNNRRSSTNDRNEIERRVQNLIDDYEFDDALELLNEAIRAHPMDAWAHTIALDVAIKADYFLIAVQQLNWHLELGADKLYALNRWVEFASYQDLDATLCLRMIQLTELFPDDNEDKAINLAQAHQVEQQLLKINEEAGLNNMSLAYLASAELIDAIGSLEDPQSAVDTGIVLVSREPDNDALLTVYAEARLNCCEINEALLTISPVFQRSPKFIKALLFVARYHTLTGNEEGAREVADIVLEQFKLSDPVACVVVLGYLGDYAAIEQYCERLDPQILAEWPVVTHALGVAKWHLGHRGKAIELWEQTIEIDPNFSIATENLLDAQSPASSRNGPWMLEPDTVLPATLFDELYELLDDFDDREESDPSGVLLERYSWLSKVSPWLLKHGDEESVRLGLGILMCLDVDAVKDQLPDKLGDCLAPVLKAYPKDSNVGYNTTDNENFWFHTQLNRSPKAATDLKQQINTLDHVFGDEVKQVRASVAGEVAALVTSKNMPTLLSAVQNAHTVYIVPFVTIGGDQVRVKGIEASLTRGNDPDRITTSFKGLVKLPETFDATTAKFFQTKDTVKQYLEKRGFRIPDGSRWEKTIENGTGRLLWECTITSPIGTSVTIEVPDEATLDDAARINIR